MGEAVAGILYGVEKLVEGAALAAKGIYDPTLPLKATLLPLTSTDVPLAYHSVSVIKGRAYLFGGKTRSKANEGVEVGDNGMHIVILPSSGIASSDYKKIEASNEAPPKRYGHSAAVIENRIYVVGGHGEDGELLDEKGRVWVFDTTSNKWSHFDPPEGAEKPEPRAYCAAVASEHPRPITKRTDEGLLPQDLPDPETMIPEIPDTDTYGTLFLQGGMAKNEKYINDLWSFDISTRSWAELPSPPPPTSTKPSLAMVANRLYTFSVGQTSYLDLAQGSHGDHGDELGFGPLAPWQSLPPTSSSPDHPYPGERSGAPLLPVTTGQGRNYLILLGGESQSGDVEEDIWALQLKPEGMTAASFKDAARMAISKDTKEAQWSELKYFNADSVMIQEGQQGRGIGPRKGVAAAKGTEVDGASVVVWGGIGADGKPRGDGLMVSVGT